MDKATQTRRIRRKDKQSGYTHTPRVNKPGKVGHMAGAVATGKVNIDVPVEEEHHRSANRTRGNFATIGELLWSKGVEFPVD